MSDESQPSTRLNPSPDNSPYNPIPADQPAAQAQNIRKGFGKGLLFTVSSTGVSIASLFLETIVAVRLISPESYGVFVLVQVVVLFYAVIVDCGGKTAVTQMVASSDPQRQVSIANTALTFRLLAVIGMSAFILLTAELQAVFDPSRSLVAYTPYVPVMLAVMTFDELNISILQGFQRYSRLAIAQVMRSVLRLTLTTVFLAVFKLDLLGLIYSWIVSYALCIVYELIVLPIPKRFALRLPQLKELLRFGAPLMATRFLFFLDYRIDVLLLGLLSGPVAVAFFGVANRVPQALQSLSEAYISVYFPTISSLLGARRDKQAAWFLNHSLRLISFLTALAALAGVVFSRQIVTLLFSEKYVDSVPAFALLMIAFHMTLLSTLMGYTLTAARRPGLSLGTNLLQVVTQTIADLIFIPPFKAIGPAIAANISAYVNNPASVLMLLRAGIRVAVLPYAAQAGLLLAGAAAYWVLQPESLLLKLAIVAAFVALNVLLGTISFNEFSLILPERLTRRRVVMPAEVGEEAPVNP
jgi:O-antigen/teichoic acid export membrane protein